MEAKVYISSDKGLSKHALDRVRHSLQGARKAEERMGGGRTGV